jgi:phage head maturation protease
MTTATERPTIQRATTLDLVARAASATLPAGVIGQVEGVALVYDVVDAHGTTFARGCLDRTVRERVTAGKVRLFLDHGDAPLNGMYDTHLHIGVVREVWDVTLPDGTTGAKFRADIFDTEPGRSAHEYLRAIAATQSETGVSIGMLRLPPRTRATVNGESCERISEVPLGEISITAMPSVPGTHVTALRADIDYTPILTGIHAALGSTAFRALTERISGNTLATDSNAPCASDADPADRHLTPTEGVSPSLATPDERLAFARAAFSRIP